MGSLVGRLWNLGTSKTNSELFVRFSHKTEVEKYKCENVTTGLKTPNKTNVKPHSLTGSCIIIKVAIRGCGYTT